MNRTIRLTFLALWLVFATATLAVRAADQPMDVDKLLKNILQAIEVGNPTQFARDGDDLFKRSATQAIVDKAKEAHSARLKAGYKATYLAELKQQGCQVHVWKLKFNDGGDDLLVRIGLQNGKIHAFLVH